MLTATQQDAVDVLGSYLLLYMALKKQDAVANATARFRRKSARDTIKPIAKIAFSDLACGRVIGAGQFGMVRIVHHKTTGMPFALKVGCHD